VNSTPNGTRDRPASSRLEVTEMTIHGTVFGAAARPPRREADPR
jgi:hypothetical protein